MVEDMRPGFPLLPIGAFTGEGTGTVDEKHVNFGDGPGFSQPESFRSLLRLRP